MKVEVKICEVKWRRKRKRKLVMVVLVVMRWRRVEERNGRITEVEVDGHTKEIN